MDNVTHTLTGLMLSRAGLNRFIPRAGLILMLSANAPDIDTISWLGGTATYLDIHRGYTHAWAVAPLLAMLPVLIGRWSMSLKSFKSGIEWSWWKAWLISFLGIASHILLDWTNNYGIRFGLPFDASWHRLDVMYVIDPWVWASLLFGVIGPFLSRMVSLEIGAKRTSGAGAAWFALIIISVYIGARSLLHERAIELLNSRIYDDRTPRRVAAFPSFANPLQWRAVAELSNGYWISDMNLRNDFDPADGRVFYQADPQPAINIAKQTTDFQALGRFDQFPLWRVIPLSEPEGAVRVELFDLRFGDPTAPGFLATAVIENGNSDRETLRFGMPKI